MSAPISPEQRGKEESLSQFGSPKKGNNPSGGISPPHYNLCDFTILSITHPTGDSKFVFDGSKLDKQYFQNRKEFHTKTNLYTLRVPY